MEGGTQAGFVLAELNTHQYMFHGVGRSEAEARDAVLRAWGRHRAWVLAQQPQLAASLPEPEAMERHFRIHYRHYASGAGYRDGSRLV